MDSPPPAPVSNRTKGIRVGIIVALACLIVVIATIIASKKSEPEPNFVWLDPTQFSLRMRPGQLKRLYYKLVNFTAPVWKHFSRPKTHIKISISVYAANGVSMADFDVAPAIGTNVSRMQAWNLSASELEELQQRLKALNGIDLVNGSTVTLADGTSASVMAGQSLPQTTQTTTFVGVCVDVTPNIAAHQFHLALSALYSEAIQGPTSIQTNLSAACRVTLQNAGGVLISSPISKVPDETNYWLILSPTAIDAYGRAIKL